jgi:hypothetical protein
VHTFIWDTKHTRKLVSTKTNHGWRPHSLCMPTVSHHVCLFFIQGLGRIEPAKTPGIDHVVQISTGFSLGSARCRLKSITYICIFLSTPSKKEPIEMITRNLVNVNGSMTGQPVTFTKLKYILDQRYKVSKKDL